MPPFLLSSLSLPFRLGLSCLMLVLLLGLVSSATHLHLHHGNRDGVPGLTLDDLIGAYHGIQTKAPLVTSLDRGHPKDLPAADKEALVKWLQLPDQQLAPAFDDTKAGDRAPAEILDKRCLSCHSRDSKDGDGIGKKVPLQYWDDVKKQAESRTVEPNALPIVIASAHTHALGMGSLTLMAVLMAVCTRWSRKWVGLLACGAGIGLLCDLACWIPARSIESLVMVLAASGGVWMTCTIGLMVSVLAELVVPVKTKG